MIKNLQTERIIATLIDLAIYALLAIGLRWLILSAPGDHGDQGNWIVLITFLLIAWLLPALLEGIMKKTFGKMLMGIGVTGARHYRVGIAIAVFRNLMKLLLLPASLLIYFLSRNGTVIHDQIAGTDVIKL